MIDVTLLNYERGIVLRTLFRLARFRIDVIDPS